MIEIPGYIKPETWSAFCELRRLKGTRAPLTEFAARRIIDKLKNFAAQGYDADFALGEAVERGWTSVFLTADTPHISPEVLATQTYLAEYSATKRRSQTPESFAAKAAALEKMQAAGLKLRSVK